VRLHRQIGGDVVLDDAVLELYGADALSANACLYSRAQHCFRRVVFWGGSLVLSTMPDHAQGVTARPRTDPTPAVPGRVLTVLLFSQFAPVGALAGGVTHAAAGLGPIFGPLHAQAAAGGAASPRQGLAPVLRDQAVASMRVGLAVRRYWSRSGAPVQTYKL
jgi:hypothetical protein